jgi:hypothetical protein
VTGLEGAPVARYTLIKERQGTITAEYAELAEKYQENSACFAASAVIVLSDIHSAKTPTSFEDQFGHPAKWHGRPN